MWKQLFWFVILLTIVEFCISDEPQATASSTRNSAKETSEEEESEEDENTTDEQSKEKTERKKIKEYMLAQV